MFLYAKSFQIILHALGKSSKSSENVMNGKKTKLKIVETIKCSKIHINRFTNTLNCNSLMRASSTGSNWATKKLTKSIRQKSIWINIHRTARAVFGFDLDQNERINYEQNTRPHFLLTTRKLCDRFLFFSCFSRIDWFVKILILPRGGLTTAWTILNIWRLRWNGWPARFFRWSFR